MFLIMGSAGFISSTVVLGLRHKSCVKGQLGVALA